MNRKDIDSVCEPDSHLWLRLTGYPEAAGVPFVFVIVLELWNTLRHGFLRSGAEPEKISGLLHARNLGCLHCRQHVCGVCCQRKDGADRNPVEVSFAIGIVRIP
jgi:hypothetical protein